MSSTTIRVNDRCITPHGIGTVMALSLTTPCVASADVMLDTRQWIVLPITKLQPLQENNEH